MSQLELLFSIMLLGRVWHLCIILAHYLGSL